MQAGKGIIERLGKVERGERGAQAVDSELRRDADEEGEEERQAEKNSLLHVFAQEQGNRRQDEHGHGNDEDVRKEAEYGVEDRRPEQMERIYDRGIKEERRQAEQDGEEDFSGNIALFFSHGSGNILGDGAGDCLAWPDLASCSDVHVLCGHVVSYGGAEFPRGDAFAVDD